MVDATAPDDVLLAAVRGALDSGPITPSPASVYALRLAVLEKWADFDATPARSRAGWWSRRSAVAAVVTAACTLGGGTVALARPALPRPLRDVARMAGLPVNPEPADRVRRERAELERSVDVGNVTRVQTDLEDLDRAESKLTPPQRARAQAADDDLEQRARTITGGHAITGGQTGEESARDATPEPARPEPTETQPASSPPAPTNDDRTSTTTTAPAAPPPSSGEATPGGGGSPGGASPSGGQESPATTTTTPPPSSSDDTHSMSTSSTTTEVLQTTTVDH